MNSSLCSLHTIRFAFSYICLFPESHCHPSRDSHRWLTVSIYYPVGFLSFQQPSLPPTPPYSSSFLGPLVLSQLAHNFQTFSILLGQKWARLVLVALCADFRAAVLPLQSEPDKHTTCPHTQPHIHTLSIPKTPPHSCPRKYTRSIRTQGFTRADLPHFCAQG